MDTDAYVGEIGLYTKPLMGRAFITATHINPPRRINKTSCASVLTQRPRSLSIPAYFVCHLLIMNIAFGHYVSLFV